VRRGDRKGGEVTKESEERTERGGEDTRGMRRFHIRPSAKSALLNVYFTQNFAPIVEKRADHSLIAAKI